MKRNVARKTITLWTCRILDPVNPDIDYYGAFSYELGSNEFRFPNRSYKDIGAPSNLWQIAAARMDDRYRRIAAFAFPQKKQRQRFTNKHAPADDNNMRAGQLNAAFGGQTLAT